MTVKKILAIGDSWTHLGAPILQNELKKHSNSYIVTSVPHSGSTAQQWASNPMAIKQAVYGTPDANLIWLSVGGNDITHKFMQGYTIETGLPAIQKDIETILDVIIDTAPFVKIVHFGYDFPAFPDMMLQMVGQRLSTVNQLMINFSTMLQSIADNDKYKGKFYRVHTCGVLQAASGIPNAPNLLMPSPNEFMNDPIHPNARGFGVLMAKFYQDYLKAELESSTEVTAPTEEEEDEQAVLERALRMSMEQ
jgi:lysophospholipase L1-like esterase